MCIQIRILRPNLETNRLRLIYLGRVLTDGVRLVPYMVALLRKQQEQENRDNRSNLGDLIEGVVNRAVHTFDESDTGEASDDRHTAQQSAASMNPYEGYSDSKKPSTRKDKGKGKQQDPKRKKDPLAGLKIWLHCSVGEPGSLEQEAEAPAEPEQVK